MLPVARIQRCFRGVRRRLDIRRLPQGSNPPPPPPNEPPEGRNGAQRAEGAEERDEDAQIDPRVLLPFECPHKYALHGRRARAHPEFRVPERTGDGELTTGNEASTTEVPRSKALATLSPVNVVAEGSEEKNEVTAGDAVVSGDVEDILIIRSKGTKYRPRHGRPAYDGLLSRGPARDAIQFTGTDCKKCTAPDATDSDGPGRPITRNCSPGRYYRQHANTYNVL